MSSRYIPDAVKALVLQRQNNKCANNPAHPAIGLTGYACPIWICYEGEPDDSGFQYDHINELSLTQNNDPQNIQALCPCCHAVKTKRFTANKRQFTSTELHEGKGYMDVDEGDGARKKPNLLGVRAQPKKRGHSKKANVSNLMDYLQID